MDDLFFKNGYMGLGVVVIFIFNIIVVFFVGKVFNVLLLDYVIDI